MINSGACESLITLSTYRRIIEAQDDLKQSDYLKSTIETLTEQLQSREINEIICFGIGHFGDCLISRYQLAFILAIKEAFKANRIEFHEPILSDAEVNILTKFECQVHPVNVEGKLPLNPETAFTLLYLPHCPKQLTNNLLWKNWSVQLNKTLLICNSFTNLISSTPARFLCEDASFVVKIQPYVEEIAFENNFRFSDIFNDLSLHTFPTDRLAKVPETVWSENSEPKYSNDIEFIAASLTSNLRLS